MFSRSEIRHACYRAKNKVATARNREILALVEPLMQHNHRWDNFAEVWDVIVTRDKEIKIVYPETNYDYIHTTLLKAVLYVELGRPFDDLDDRAFSLVTQVEQLMLDGVMTWANYNTVWGVVVDPSTNSIKTTMYNVKPSQIEVTAEMIEASKKDADGSAFTSSQEVATTTLEMKSMDEAQRKAFEEFLATKHAQKG